VQNINYANIAAAVANNARLTADGRAPTTNAEVGDSANTVDNWFAPDSVRHALDFLNYGQL